MTIHIEDLKFECIIGILDFERVKPQDIILNVTIDYQFKTEYINYADVANLLQKEMKNQNFHLIEEALSYLQQKLKENFPLIQTLNLKITKPSILPDCMVSVSNRISFNS